MICSFGQQTCGACCWSPCVSRGELERRLRRHQRLFEGRAPGALPSMGALVAHELRARRGADLLWSPLLLLPWIGPRLRGWLSRRAVCAFAAFRDRGERQVGCLIHPSLHQGRDVRRRAAFRLLSGLGCGTADYACAGASRFETAEASTRARFRQRVRRMDWHEYGRVAPSFDFDESA